MSVVGNAYVEVYRVLDEVCAGGSIPSGARGRVFTAIDRLRLYSVPTEHVATAESVSIALHRLDWAVLARATPEEARVREELKVLCDLWRQIPTLKGLN